MTKSASAKALRIKDILNLKKWNKTDEGKGKTLKHVRWIPSESCYNVPVSCLNLKKASDQRGWVQAYCGGDKVKFVQFAILKGALNGTENRKPRLFAHKIEAFYFVNGQFTSEEIAEMIQVYNLACTSKDREDMKIVTKVFETTVKKSLFDDFWE
jgi:hypothetical protein